MSGWYRPSQKLGKDNDSSWAYRDCWSTQPLAAYSSFDQLFQAWLKPGEAGDGWCHSWRTVSFVIYSLPQGRLKHSARHSETGTTPVSWSLLFPEGTQHAWNGFWKPLSSVSRVQHFDFVCFSAGDKGNGKLSYGRRATDLVLCSHLMYESCMTVSDHVSDCLIMSDRLCLCAVDSLALSEAKLLPSLTCVGWGGRWFLPKHP